MTKLLCALGAAALALTGTQASAETAAEKAEAKFAELTEGRVAGEPQSCITAMRSSDIKVVEYVGITYEQGDTLWIARASNPNSLDYWDVPVINRFGSQLCKHDVTRTVDRHSNFAGAVFLGDFIPYTKVDEGEG